jgi:hypothetical protein
MVKVRASTAGHVLSSHRRREGILSEIERAVITSGFEVILGLKEFTDGKKSRKQAAVYPLILFFTPRIAPSTPLFAFSSGIRRFPLRISSGRALKIVECSSPVQWDGAALV